MIFRLTLFALIISCSSVFAQKESSFATVEQQIEKGIPKSELGDTKGWKYEHRWLDEFKKRVAPDGSFYDGEVFYREAQRVAAMKKSHSASRQSGWVPVGPDHKADNSLTKGLGRINCITFHPTDTNTYWVGVAQGGVWKTTNSGGSWTPLTDDLPILRISDIAVDPNHPDTMYICVGDYAYMDVALNLDDRDRHSHYGIGVYKTTDGGTTWSPTGLTYEMDQLDQSLMRRVFVHHNYSDSLLAAGVGGIWTSTDGGDTWEQQVDSMIWDLEADPNDPMTLYATTGYLKNSQTGVAGIMKSTDFGYTWEWLNTGIPETVDVLRIEVAVAPTNSDHIYALACANHKGFYGIYSSTDGGTNWTYSDAGGKNILEWYDGSELTGGQGTYDLSLLVDPVDENTIYTGGINVWKSMDGGATFEMSSLWYDDLHADQHQFRYNPLDDKFYICNDGGLVKTDTIKLYGDNNWEYASDGMQTNSFYRIGLSAGNSGNFSAGAQDNSTYYINNGSWINTFGGDGMETVLHPTDPDIIFGSSQYGNIRYSTNGGVNYNYIDIPNNEDGEWTTPYMYKPGSEYEIFAGFGNLYSAYPGSNFNNQWSNFSNMPGSFVPAPISHFNIAQSNTDYIYVAKRIYHSYNQPSEMWMTPDHGVTWNNITAGLPDSLYFNYVEIDNDDPLNVWLVVAGYEADQHVFHSTDGGTTWENITYDLPNLPTNCIVHHDSSLYNVVYVGTDIGVYYTNDTLQAWLPVNDNLPNVIVSELDIHYNDQKLYAATFGRGVWMMDLMTTEMVQPDTTTAPPSSIEDLFNNTDVQLYPNPGKGTFELTISGLTGQLLLEVVDIMGKTVHDRFINLSESSYQETIETNLPPGMYFLRLSAKNKMLVKRFVVE